MILIVEDEALIAMDMQDTLHAQGFETRVAATFEDATEQARIADIEVAVLDYFLRGGQSSEEVAKILRDRGIPFIVSSGSDSGTDIEAFRDALRLSKPFSSEELEQAVARAARMGRRALEGANS